MFFKDISKKHSCIRDPRWMRITIDCIGYIEGIRNTHALPCTPLSHPAFILTMACSTPDSTSTLIIH